MTTPQRTTGPAKGVTISEWNTLEQANSGGDALGMTQEVQQSRNQSTDGTSDEVIVQT